MVAERRILAMLVPLPSLNLRLDKRVQAHPMLLNLTPYSKFFTIFDLGILLILLFLKLYIHIISGIGS